MLWGSGLSVWEPLAQSSKTARWATAELCSLNLGCSHVKSYGSVDPSRTCLIYKREITIAIVRKTRDTERKSLGQSLALVSTDKWLYMDHTFRPNLSEGIRARKSCRQGACTVLEGEKRASWIAEEACPLWTRAGGSRSPWTPTQKPRVHRTSPKSRQNRGEGCSPLTHTFSSAFSFRLWRDFC